MSQDAPRDARDRRAPLYLEILLEAAGERVSAAREHPGTPSAAFRAELESLAAAARRRLSEAPDPPESLGEMGTLFVDPQRLDEMTRPAPTAGPVADPAALTAALQAAEQFLDGPRPDAHSRPEAHPMPEACPTPAPPKGVRLADLDPEDRARLRREAEEKAAEEVAERLAASLLDLDPATLTEPLAASPTAPPTPFLGAGVPSSVDQVAALLRQLVGPDVLAQDLTPSRDERVARLSSELIRAVA